MVSCHRLLLESVGTRLNSNGLNEIWLYGDAYILHVLLLLKHDQYDMRIWHIRNADSQ